ncbi:unnamed protein product, partial [Ectocarpus sp. 12 AP-2014]
RIPHEANASVHVCGMLSAAFVLALSSSFGSRVSAFSGASSQFRSAAVRNTSRRTSTTGKVEPPAAPAAPAAARTVMSSPAAAFIDIGANLLDDVFQGRYHGGSQKHEPDLHAVLERASGAGVEKV